jgi:hypothetical protein
MNCGTEPSVRALPGPESRFYFALSGLVSFQSGSQAVGQRACARSGDFFRSARKRAVPPQTICPCRSVLHSSSPSAGVLEVVSLARARPTPSRWMMETRTHLPRVFAKAARRLRQSIASDVDRGLPQSLRLLRNDRRNDKLGHSFAEEKSSRFPLRVKYSERVSILWPTKHTE